MRNPVGLIAALLAVLIIPGLLIGQTGERANNSGATQERPKSSPDISGVWWPPRETSLSANDRNSLFGKQNPDMTPGGQEKFKSSRPLYENTPSGVVNRLETDPSYNCFPPGVPGIYTQVGGAGGPMEMLEVPGRVVILYEYDHYVRQIYIDGQHSSGIAPTWMGDSIGKWEGDTLVVDSTGFNDKTVLDREGHPHSDALHVIERIRRLDPKTLEVGITIDDPKVYTKPWGGRLIYGLEPTWRIMENLCMDNASFLDFVKKAYKEPGK